MIFDEKIKIICKIYYIRKYICKSLSNSKGLQNNWENKIIPLLYIINALLEGINIFSSQIPRKECNLVLLQMSAHQWQN